MKKPENYKAARNYRSAAESEIMESVSHGDERGIYAVRCRETGDVIELGLTAAEAVKLLHDYEREDMNECVYIEDFYDIGIIL